MPMRAALSKILALGALLLVASLAFVTEGAKAQQTDGANAGQRVFTKPHRGPAIGGTSWTLSDVWGEPKMPPAPTDFGPGFDFPSGYNLNGAPNQSPYPN